MIAAIVFAHVWGLLQLVVLGSFARTVRIRTVLAAMAAGLYACAAVAVLLELAWIRPAAWITGTPFNAVVQTASYTVDPFVEEGVKVLPLVILLQLVRVIRRQWSITDCVLVGAALGSGFGLAENLYRYSGAVANAVWTEQGWVLRWNLATIVIVPGPLMTVASWLPAPVVARDVLSLLPRAASPINIHLAWSAIGGFGIGLILLHRTSIGRRAGIILLTYVGIDHALSNAANHSPNGVIGVLSVSVRSLLWFLPVVALAVGWWLDRQRQNPNTISDLALAAERTASSPMVGTLRTAISHPPGTLAWVDSLVRLRRAYASAVADSGADDRLRRLIVGARDRIDSAVAQSGDLPIRASGWTWAAFLTYVQQPKVIVWAVMIAPSVLSFGVGGFPAIAWLHSALARPPLWTVVRLLSGAALAWTAWNIIVSVRLWAPAVQSPLADLPATFALGLLSGVAALVAGAHLFVLCVTGSSNAHVIGTIHVVEASQMQNVTNALLLAAAGGLLALALLSGVGELAAAGALASGEMGLGATLGTAEGLGTFDELMLGGLLAMAGLQPELGQSQTSRPALPDTEIVVDPYADPFGKTVPALPDTEIEVDPDADPFGGTLVPGIEAPPGELPSNWPEGVDPLNPKIPKPPKVPRF